MRLLVVLVALSSCSSPPQRTAHIDNAARPQAEHDQTCFAGTIERNDKRAGRFVLIRRQDREQSTLEEQWVLLLDGEEPSTISWTYELVVSADEATFKSEPPIKFTAKFVGEPWRWKTWETRQTLPPSLGSSVTTNGRLLDGGETIEVIRAMTFKSGAMKARYFGRQRAGCLVDHERASDQADAAKASRRAYDDCIDAKLEADREPTTDEIEAAIDACR